MRQESQRCNRREVVTDALGGLSGIALAWLLGEAGLLAGETQGAASGPTGGPTGGTDGEDRHGPQIDRSHPFAPRAGHFRAQADSVIVVFCSGALSHVDTFDFKPELVRYDGRPLPQQDRLISFQGENGNLQQPLWEFKPRGACGKLVSELVPRIGALSDDICYLHGMTTKSNTHGPAENVMSTGFTHEGFPSMGAWMTYALGSENQNLPAFVAIEDPRGMPQSGPNNWASGFLPAAFQGTPLSSTKPVRYLKTPAGMAPKADAAARDALRHLNERHLDRFPGEQQLAARIASYQLAARMQLSVPRAAALDEEPQHIVRLYGADSPHKEKAAFARNCILARRLVQRGVRFVQLFNGAYASGGRLNWDGHSQLKAQYDVHGDILDQPVAALLTDLKQQGMLESTLLVFCTEFGRMPMFQVGTYGRDHNPFGFTCWIAGAGVRAPYSYGVTDSFGFKATEQVTTVHDFHATLLHLLGLDHKKLTFYHNGIQRRLTDVHGRVVHEVLG